MKSKVMRVVKKIVAGAILTACVFICKNDVKAGSAITFPNYCDQLPIFQSAMGSADFSLLNDYQAIAVMQYQQQVQAQYAAALAVQQNFLNQSQTAIAQAYMLKAIQEKQKQQYASMVAGTGLPYADYLLSQYDKNIAPAQNAFIGYEGIQLWVR